MRNVGEAIGGDSAVWYEQRCIALSKLLHTIEHCSFHLTARRRSLVPYLKLLDALLQQHRRTLHVRAAAGNRLHYQRRPCRFVHHVKDHRLRVQQSLRQGELCRCREGADDDLNACKYAIHNITNIIM